MSWQLVYSERNKSILFIKGHRHRSIASGEVRSLKILLEPKPHNKKHLSLGMDLLFAFSMIANIPTRVGDYVTYWPRIDMTPELGRVKRIQTPQTIDGKVENVWVVYKCNGEWHNYLNYTGALTSVKDLIPFKVSLDF